MKSHWKTGLCLLVVVAATALVTAQVVGQDGAAQDDGTAQMIALGTPGPHHEHLKEWEGAWKLSMKFDTGEGGEWQESEMSSKGEVIMDGRYLLEKVSGEFEMAPGQKVPFEGLSIMGYDNFKKEYFSIWLDSMSTACFIERGQMTGDDELTLIGDNLDAHSGKIVKTKSVVTIIDEDTRKLEMFMPDSSGEHTKSMEITYTRK